MSDTCNSAPQGMPEPPKPNFQVPSNENSNICHVIAIMSGKGGVGKSLMTSLLASRVSEAGLSRRHAATWCSSRAGTVS